MDLASVELVLVRPSRVANVAAACRAMKNMGLRRLWLVDPPSDIGDFEPRALAYGAWDVLDGARRASDILEAVSASRLVAATTGRAVASAVTPRAFAAELEERAGGGAVSIVFGPEASGLTRHELSLCHLLLHVPTDPVHPSLNLAQAVLLIAYELRLASLATGGAAPVPGGVAATAGELEQAVQEMREALLAIGYLDPANPERILTEWRRLLARAAPTHREVGLLRGLARQTGWAGRVARGRSRTG